MRSGADLEAQNVATIPMARVVLAGQNDPTVDAQVVADMATLDKMEVSIRHSFIRKVFALLAMQISILMGICCIFMYVPEVSAYAASSASTWLTVVSGILFLVTLIALTCVPYLNKKYPQNVIGLFLLAGFAGVFVGTFVADVEPEFVWIAFAVSMGLMLVLGLFASQTRFDFTGFGPYISVLMLLLLVFSLFGGLSPIYRAGWGLSGRGMLFLTFALIIFSMYIVYDVQLVVGGKHRLQFGVDDYVVATISLFTDFIMVFVLIVGLGGNN